MALSAEQRRVLDAIRQGAQRNRASPKELKAAVQTGIVESNLRNLPGGDADSAGWRQERGSLYKDPTNLDASIDRFFQETKAVRGKYARAGDLAAAVQRPAAQYRGRYQAVSAQAQKLLETAGGSAPRSATPAQPNGAPVTPGGMDRQGLLSQYLATRGQPGGLAALGEGLGSLRAPRAPQTAAPSAPTDRVELGGKLAEYAQRAATIDAKRLPYQWGGGHGGKVDPAKATPLDCSGAVSAVLGINPRVSGDFAKWGKPGAGDGKGVVVYSSPKHVLMSIGGKFFATSASNPGGGAGWVPKSKITPEYLKGFTARHQ